MIEFIGPYIVSWLCVIGIFAFMVFARYVQGSWTAPGVVFAGTWVCAAGLPLLFAPDLKLFPIAYIVVFIFVVLAVLGTSLGVLFNRGEHVDLKYEFSKDTQKALFKVVCFLTIFACLAPLYAYYHAASMFGTKNVVMIAAKVSIARYQENYNPPPLLRGIILILYLTSFFCGFLMAIDRYDIKHKILTIIVGTCALGIVVVQTTRSSFVSVVIFWLSAFLSAYSIFNKDNDAINIWRIIKLGIQGAVFIILLFGGGFLLRGGKITEMDTKGWHFLFIKLKLTLLAHLSTFGYWLNYNIAMEEPNYGLSSLAGLADLFGLRVRELGLYKRGFAASLEGIETNIYTAFRPLIEDYTFGGGLVIILLFSIFAGMAWSSINQGRFRAGVVLIAYYIYAMWSPITSYFAYNSTLLIVLLGGVFFAFLKTFKVSSVSEECSE